VAIEDAADLAAFFDVAGFAVSATWTVKGGGPVAAVPVILDRPDQSVALGGAAVNLPELSALAQVAALPAGAGKGDTLAAGADTWVVTKMDYDETRLVVRASLRVA